MKTNQAGACRLYELVTKQRGQTMPQHLAKTQRQAAEREDSMEAKGTALCMPVWTSVGPRKLRQAH